GEWCPRHRDAGQAGRTHVDHAGSGRRLLTHREPRTSDSIAATISRELPWGTGTRLPGRTGGEPPPSPGGEAGVPFAPGTRPLGGGAPAAGERGLRAPLDI
ncbi:MAG: hypothetical protein AVDCRST_MAG49-1071, partial [uncultured Thermomicrobiales bacterium]